LFSQCPTSSPTYAYTNYAPKLKQVFQTRRRIIHITTPFHNLLISAKLSANLIATTWRQNRLLRGTEIRNATASLDLVPAIRITGAATVAAEFSAAARAVAQLVTFGGAGLRECACSAGAALNGALGS